jgi:hypothetical protein
VELKAKDDDDAEYRALERVWCDAIPEEDWRLVPFDPECYVAHVELVLSENEAGDAKERAEFIEELRSVKQDEWTRYLILHADTGGGSGKVLWQPWFSEAQPELLEHDVAGDWAQELSRIVEEGLENFEEAATAKPDITVPDTKRAILLGFPTGDPLTEESLRPDPRQYRTEIPELLHRPLSKAEHDAVLDCLAALDPVLGAKHADGRDAD